MRVRACVCVQVASDDNGLQPSILRATLDEWDESKVAKGRQGGGKRRLKQGAIRRCIGALIQMERDTHTDTDTGTHRQRQIQTQTHTSACILAFI